MIIPGHFVENSEVTSYLYFLEETGFCGEIKYSKWGINFAHLLS